MRSPTRLPQVLNDGEIEAFLGSLRTHRDRAIFLLMLVAGLRKQEVADLQMARSGLHTPGAARNGLSCCVLEYHRERANTPRVRCHLFRHTCFSNLCGEGACWSW
ncbi:MAG TPA: hypothetical protein VNT26_07385 [Candidatus Sulfotelmatobacter sp.]|nr:hypothetical protein [Candidatus Sulfotelmatobacter sp.]